MALKFSRSGPKQARRQLQAVERRLDVSFPEDYRDFLLMHNGGVPKPKTLRADKGGAHEIEFFYSIGVRASDRELVNMTEHYREELELPHHYLPVAFSGDHDVLLLHVAGRSIGKVDWWTGISEGFYKQHVSRYCRSFSELLERFEPAARSRNKADCERLFEAINKGKKRQIKELLQRVDLSALPKHHPHPVIQAVHGGNAVVLELLLELGLSPNVKDDFGKSAIAIAREKHKIAKRLDTFYGTAQYAQELKQAEGIVALLKHRA